jgi:GAF domain-containing protein/anti-sigma regulatory factor (Ser/Thr protein kinase)
MRGKERPKRRGARPAKAKVKAKRGAGARDLATRLAESLDQQAATAEILKIISGTPTDAQPVFDTIVRNAGRVCDAVDAVLTLRKDEEMMVGAHWGPIGAIVGMRFPLTRGSVMGRAILDARPIHVVGLPSASEFPEGRELALQFGHRTTLGVPLLREGDALGALLIRRTEVRAFSDAQIAMLQTFADQAVIAIENVRLFTELEARNREVTEALDQKTATSEILAVISRSPTHIQPVFDTIMRSAVRLSGARFAAIYRFDGEMVHFAGQHGSDDAALEVYQRMFPMRPQRGALGPRCILDRAVVQVPDVFQDPEYLGKDLARASGWNSTVAVPILREGIPNGAIVISKSEPGPFPHGQIELLKTFADQAVIAIENVRLFTELQASNRELTTALDQQTATSDILRVISQSQTDLQPVFDAIVVSAVRLLGAYTGILTRISGNRLELAALTSSDEAGDAAVKALFPRPLDSERLYAQVIRDRAPISIADVESDPRMSDAMRASAQARGFRSWVAVPLLRHDEAVGTIAVTRREPGGFTDDEITLLQTFADQAVIAIENVRLFTELEGRNRDLTATSEILRVISSSPTDVQPVFDTIVSSAVRLCDGLFSALFQFDGEFIHHGAQHNFDPKTLDEVLPTRPSRTFMPGRAILERAVVHMPDVELDPEFRYQSVSRAIGFRSGLWVPMLREGNPIGVISVTRAEPGPFSDSEIELLKTFADQAVIAIENVRLFSELQASNRELTTALDTQTATSDILRVISQSQTDVQPVFEAIVASAVRLLRAYTGGLGRIAGDQIELAALTSTDAAANAAMRARYPQPLQSEDPHAQALRDRAPFNIADADTDPRLPESARAYARVRGHRSLIVVPMLRHDEAIGTIAVARREPGGFSDDEIALLKTFADQAVIAIENVRLFTELREKNEALTVAHAQVSETLEQQTATAEILRVISSSPTDVQPVFDVIVERAVRLCGARFGRVYRFDDGVIHMVAGHGLSPVGLGTVQQVFPRPASDDTIVGRVILSRQPAFIRDIEREEGVPALSRQMIQALETRSQVTIPMLRAGEPIGALTLGWAEPEAFDEQQIALVKSFADQAVIAIENVRLFTELGARNRDLTEALEQQTATAEILRVMSQSQTDVQPVFDTIVRSAMKLCGGLNSVLFQFDGELLHHVAQHDVTPEGLEELHRVFPARPTRALGSGRAILQRTLVHIPDTELDPEFQNLALSRGLGFRSGLWVPMLREGAPIGVIAVNRAKPGPFSDSEVELLKTFADQAVIAVENVRLFKELEARNRDLTEALEQQIATAEILRVISRSQTEVQPVFDTIVRSAVRLCDGIFGGLFRFDGELLHHVAQHNHTPEALEEVHRVFPARPTRTSHPGRAILERAVVHVPDVERDPEFQHQAASRAIGLRSVLYVPMLREGAPIGVIGVARVGPGPFSGSQIELLQTFADQAVIAVENARLFEELQARTGELTRSVDQLTALGEISQAVSSTLDVETVLQTIVSRASQLAGADGCAIYEYDPATEAFHIRATHNLDPVLVATLRAAPLRKGEGAMGRAAEAREPIQVADIAAPGAYQSHIRDTLLGAGYHALLSVPLLREGEIIGSLSLNRHAPGEFPPEAVDVLKNFATQSALAIQNARLFREIADKSRQLEVASQHKSEFLANMSHELRTPLNAIIGFSEVLNERMFGELNEKQAEYLKDIHASGQHLLSLINDILDLSKVEAGRMELELTDFDLPAAVDSAVTLVRERANRKGITVRIAVGEQIGMMRGDERKIRQVLLNLLSNAIKFTPEGGRIEVAAVPNDGSVEVSVHDTGVGIAPEDHEAVFEEFRQVGESAAKQEGTGLGLALARKFIELHGGKIWVTSQVGAGSTFTFTVPLQRPSGA